MKKKKEINKGSIIPTINRLKIYLLFLVIVPAILYYRVINFGFSGFDDSSLIANITNSVGNKFDLKEAFTHDAFMSNNGDVYYRPMQTVSLMTDAVEGGDQPWIYHLTNLLLHILTVLALFFFLKKIGIKEEISFLLSLSFSIHPLFTHAVAWIPARGDLLLALFSLLSIITFLEYFEKNKVVYLILHAIVFLIAVFSKEMGLLIPLLLLLYSYLVLNKVFRFKKMSPFFAIWIFSYASFYIMRHNVVRIALPSSMFGIIPLIKNLPAIPIIFGKFLIPYNLNSMPLFDILSLIIGVLLLSGFIILIVKFKQGKEKIILWGTVWFLAFSIPPMFFRAFSAQFAYEYFEYRAYLPMIGILIITGMLLNNLFDKYSFKQILNVAVPVFIVYGVIAFYHSNVFSDPERFYSSAIEANANNALAYAGRGNVYLNNNQLALAIGDFDNSILVCQVMSEPYFKKGVIYNSLNDHIRAEQFYSLALKYDTLYPAENKTAIEFSYIHLAVEKMILKKYDETILLLNKALKNNPENVILHNDLGLAYSYSGKPDSAQYEYSIARKLGYNEKNGK